MQRWRGFLHARPDKKISLQDNNLTRKRPYKKTTLQENHKAPHHPPGHWTISTGD
jgi:hypothetical protein